MTVVVPTLPPPGDGYDPINEAEFRRAVQLALSSVVGTVSGPAPEEESTEVVTKDLEAVFTRDPEPVITRTG